MRDIWRAELLAIRTGTAVVTRELPIFSRVLGVSGQCDAAQYRALQHKLVALMDREKDSLRFYNLGDRYEKKVEHFGAKPSYQPEGFLEL